jgi:hypothetical protein
MLVQLGMLVNSGEIENGRANLRFSDPVIPMVIHHRDYQMLKLLGVLGIRSLDGEYVAGGEKNALELSYRGSTQATILDVLGSNVDGVSFNHLNSPLPFSFRFYCIGGMLRFKQSNVKSLLIIG